MEEKSELPCGSGGGVSCYNKMGGNVMLLLVFLVSIAVLLLCIIKIKLNAFVALLVCAYGTGLLALATYAGGGRRKISPRLRT